jgi:hypothetical protein
VRQTTLLILVETRKTIKKYILFDKIRSKKEKKCIPETSELGYGDGTVVYCIHP